MPLLEHFRPPLSVTHPWTAFHSAWANAITNQLNEVLPEDYYAIPEVTRDDQIEIDVATLEGPAHAGANGGTATAVWAPPRPSLAAPVDFSRIHGTAIRVFQDQGGPQLRAAIELVSPANKDRPRSRSTFAAKCVGYLERGVHVVVLDTVTLRHANLHTEIAQVLEATEALAWDSETHLYAVSYRTVARDRQTLVEAWPHSLTLGQELPTLPLWLRVDLCLPLPLEANYTTACHALRIPQA